jgi:hypothetical protein
MGAETTAISWESSTKDANCKRLLPEFDRRPDIEQRGGSRCDRLSVEYFYA